MRWLGTLTAMALAALAACRSTDDAVVPAVRLAREEARAAGRHEPATLALDMTTRYVLGAGPATWRQGAVVVDDAGRGRLEVACPAELAGRLAVFDARVVSRADAVAATESDGAHPRLVRRRCPSDGPRPVVIPLGRVGTGITVGGAHVRESPSLRQTTRPVTLARGAELRVAVGVVHADDGQARAPRRFAVHAAAADGRRLTLIDASAPARGRWTELRIPLEAARTWLGSRVQLVFEQGVSPDDDAAWIAWGDPTIFRPRSAADAVPPVNVLLVSLDTLRSDRLGAYGYPLRITPILDGLAREGTLFEQAISQASWTAPSHATMLTGTYPCLHGLSLLKHPTVVGHPLPVGVRPLAEILADAGYSSAAFTEDAFVDPGSFHRGFDLFVADSRVEQAGDAATLDSTTPGFVEQTVDGAVRWLRAHAGQRFFLFVHTYQVHKPFVPPAAYEAIAAMRPLPVRPGAPRHSPGAEEDAARYTAEVAYTDASLAPLFDALHELGLANETLVVVTSDHGQSFGEKGVLGHGTSILEEQIRVPLIWWAPGRVAAGQRIASMVGVVDIVPTVLDLVGLPIPAWVQGVSLRPMLQPGYRDSGVSNRVLPAEAFWLMGMRGDTWKVERLVTGEYRSMHVTAHGDEPLVRRPMAAATSGAFARHDEDCAKARAHLGARGEAPPAPAADAIDPDRERKLRALGYLQ